VKVIVKNGLTIGMNISDSIYLMVGCIVKLDLYNDSKFCGKPPVKETVETPVTPTSLSVDCLESKTDRISIKLLHFESVVRYKYPIQMMEYCYMDKGSGR
jgi:hypothetical protein